MYMPINMEQNFFVIVVIRGSNEVLLQRYR